MSEWRECKLSDHIDLISGYAFKSKDFLDYQEKGTLPVIKIKNVANGDVSLEKVVYHKYNESLSKFVLSKGDVLIAMTGNHPQAQTQVVGAVSKYKINSYALLNQRVGKIVPIGNTVLDFVYYFFKDKDTHRYLANESSGSANQANISKATIIGINSDFPEPEEQKAIAEVLSSLDDKIDLLHRQNKTLEQMAETLFRQWFQPPNPLKGEEAREDWEEGVVADLAEHLKKSIKPQQNKDTLFYHYSIPSYDNGKEPVQEMGKEIKSNKYEIPNNCILFSKLNPHKDKRVWLLQDNLPDNPICSTEFQIVYPKNENSLYFLYGWLYINENYKEIASGVGGTSGSHQRISPSEIFDFRCPKIPNEQLNEYDLEVKPIYKKQFKNQTQIRTLESLRDTLLPKLMSGEIRVKL